MRLKNQLLFYFFFLFSFAWYAQNNGQLIEKSLDPKVPFTITQFSARDGLPQSRVLDIVPRKNGSLIISTASGVVEYKGGKFNNFITDKDYKNKTYNKVFWNENWKHLYGKGSDSKLYMLYPQFKVVSDFSVTFLNGDSLYSIDKDGTIYAAHVTNPVFEKRIHPGIKNAHCLYYTADEVIISSPEGIFRYNLKTGKTLRLSEKSCHLIKKNPYNNLLYALGPDEIYSLKDSGIHKIFDLKPYQKNARCSQIAFTGINDIYVTTTCGLFEINSIYTDHYTQKSSFPSSHLLALYFNTTENCLFVGTGEKGMLKLEFKTCYSFSAEHGFGEGTALSSIIKTKKGKLFMLDPAGKIYHMGSDSAVSWLSFEPFGASLSEIDGNILLGTRKRGILLVKEKKIYDSISYPGQLPGIIAHACFRDSRGTIWVGTNNGVARGKTLKTIKPCLGDTVKNALITFFELKDGSICIGGSEGVYILDRNYRLLLHLGKKDGLLGKEVRAFHQDEQGKLWIGSYGGGLYCYENKKLRSINRMEGAMLDEDIFCLAKDNFGYLYMTSNHGLYRIKEKDLIDFYNKKINYLIPFHYKEEAGILNTEFNGGFQNNYLKSKLNHFYFPSLQGAVVVMPEKPEFRVLEPLIDQISVNDEIVDQEKHSFDRETFSIEFKFSTTAFLNKYNVYYQYKLDGEKASNWSLLDKNTSVTYKLIPPGSYTFSVRAIDAFNDPKPKVSSFSFEIKPYFYETLWFKIAGTCLFILSVIIVVWFGIQQYRRKSEEKEKVKRQVAELKLQAIQAQMNPHFIFNSLNSIKYYLSSNDQINADKYIDHFSKLLRNFMENGSQSFITLRNEILMLTSYLELEKQRMNPSFDFYVDLQDGLQDVEIPTHLIQPFVENAIKHGINHSLTKCKLTIHFSKNDNMIVCVIEDNGIGRKKSKEINKDRSSHHNSKGLEIVSEKIRVIKEIYNIHIKLSIEDASKNGTGTRVTLHIPIKRNESINS